MTGKQALGQIPRNYSQNNWAPSLIDTFSTVRGSLQHLFSQRLRIRKASTESRQL